MIISASESQDQKQAYPLLYRGEDLRTMGGNGNREARVRTLRDCLAISERSLPTPNIGTNSPYYHFRNCIAQMIDHIAQGAAPCFLSFTESEDCAFYYASSGEEGFYSRCNEYGGPPQYSHDAEWKDNCVLVIKIDLSNAGLKKVPQKEKGVYLAEYDLPYNHSSKGVLLVIDVVTLLSSHPIQDENDARAFENSRKDKEWLIVPMSTIDVGRGCHEKSELIRTPDFPLITFSFIDPNEFV